MRAPRPPPAPGPAHNSVVPQFHVKYTAILTSHIVPHYNCTSAACNVGPSKDTSLRGASRLHRRLMGWPSTLMEERRGRLHVRRERLRLVQPDGPGTGRRAQLRVGVLRGGPPARGRSPSLRQLVMGRVIVVVAVRVGSSWSMVVSCRRWDRGGGPSCPIMGRSSPRRLPPVWIACLVARIGAPKAQLRVWGRLGEETRRRLVGSSSGGWA